MQSEERAAGVVSLTFAACWLSRFRIDNARLPPRTGFNTARGIGLVKNRAPLFGVALLELLLAPLALGLLG